MTQGTQTNLFWGRANDKGDMKAKSRGILVVKFFRLLNANDINEPKIVVDAISDGLRGRRGLKFLYSGFSMMYECSSRSSMKQNSKEHRPTENG
jgi:hypothetical protein